MTPSGAPHAESAPTGPPRSAPLDPSELLNLGTPIARVLLVVIVLAQVVFAVGSLSVMAHPALVIAALMVFAGAAVVLGNAGTGQFPRLLTVVVVGAGVLVTVLVEAGLPVAGGLGYAGWHFGAVTWLAFFLAFRGRVAAGWVLLALMFAITVVWTVTVGRGPLDAVDLCIRHAGTLLMATLFRVLLTRGARRLDDVRQERLARAAAAAASAAEIDERGRQAVQLAADARPVLARIARGEYLDAESRREFMLVEASLRDALRGRELATPAIAAAATAARSRGAEVVLLDDRSDELPPADAALVEAAVVDELRSLADGRLTVRLLPAGRELVATIVRDDRDGHRRRDFAPSPTA